MSSKKTKNISPTLYILPSNNSELQLFSKKFKIDMMEQVIVSIEFAIKNKLSLIEVFQFKNSDFVITLSKKDYSANLNNVYSYCIENELYEYCPRILSLQKKINKFIKTTDEK